MAGLKLFQSGNRLRVAQLTVVSIPSAIHGENVDLSKDVVNMNHQLIRRTSRYHRLFMLDRVMGQLAVVLRW